MLSNLSPTNNGNGQRKFAIFRRLQCAAEQVRLKYEGRKELASEGDEIIIELCEALEDAFSYGLKQPHSIGLLQNMQEIVIGNNSSGNEITFWDFCQEHLTPHERDRYLGLKEVHTKFGRGMSFIRNTLNENSLRRYLLTWLSCEQEMQRYYAPWSLLLDSNIQKELPTILEGLSGVLFALVIDTKAINTSDMHNPATMPRKEEPIIFAPAPIPVVNTKHKHRKNAIVRPIKSGNSIEDLNEICEMDKDSKKSDIVEGFDKFDAVLEALNISPKDPIEPKLKFFKKPLGDLYTHQYLGIDNNAAGGSSGGAAGNFDTTGLLLNESANDVCDNEDDKSDTSSQQSKSSSALSFTQNQPSADNPKASLEEKLREMSERCILLETRVAQLSLENRQLIRRLTQQFNETGINPSSSLATNFLITIPNATLLKSKHGGNYYSYEIHITMRQNLEYWCLNKRYREFYKLHKTLLRTHPCVSAIEFPPKKHFGNMNLLFVEERRQQLQIYLLNLVEMLPQVEACKSKMELTKVFPFFRER